MNEKNVTQQQTTTTELQAPDLGRAHTQCDELNMLKVGQPPPESF